MGNCFGNKKKNRVGPAKQSGRGKIDASEIIGQNTPFQQPTVEQQKDMVKDLTEKGQKPAVSKGGVSFVVDFTEGNAQRMPSRLADRLDGSWDEEEEDKDKKEVEYTDEEKALMAELFRDDIIREKKEKAAREEEKVRQAARRRYEMERQKMEKLGHKPVQKDDGVESKKEERG